MGSVRSIYSACAHSTGVYFASQPLGHSGYYIYMYMYIYIYETACGLNGFDRFSLYPVILLTDQLYIHMLFSKSISTTIRVHKTHTSDEIKRMEHVPLEG
jgi:hypothetical protein